MSHYSIFGGRVLVFGDLHLSCTYEGQHRDYIVECYKNMGNIVDKVKEQKASAVFFLGDIIGVNERNLRDRQFLMRVLLFFKTLNDLTNGNVYSVKGNHDKGDFSDFDLLIGMGLLKSPDYVDYYGVTKEELSKIHYEGSEEGYSKFLEDELSGSHEVRFHFVNYGEEDRDLSIVDSGCSHVVLAHADFLIDGVTNWYHHKDGIHLGRQKNFEGVSLVIAGHIHNPSDQVYSTLIGDSTVDLFYTGSPSRTAERYDDCWYMSFEYTVGEDGSATTEYNPELFGLEPADVVFYPKEDFINEGKEDEESRRKESESLTNIVKEILEGRMTGGDLFNQVRAVPNASDRAKEIACDYLQRAIDMSK